MQTVPPVTHPGPAFVPQPVVPVIPPRPAVPHPGYPAPQNNWYEYSNPISSHTMYPSYHPTQGLNSFHNIYQRPVPYMRPIYSMGYPPYPLPQHYEYGKHSQHMLMMHGPELLHLLNQAAPVLLPLAPQIIDLLGKLGPGLISLAIQLAPLLVMSKMPHCIAKPHHRSLPQDKDENEDLSVAASDMEVAACTLPDFKMSEMIKINPIRYNQNIFRHLNIFSPNFPQHQISQNRPIPSKGHNRGMAPPSVYSEQAPDDRSNSTLPFDNLKSPKDQSLQDTNSQNDENTVKQSEISRNAELKEEYSGTDIFKENTEPGNLQKEDEASISSPRKITATVYYQPIRKMKTSEEEERSKKSKKKITATIIYKGGHFIRLPIIKIKKKSNEPPKLNIISKYPRSGLNAVHSLPRYSTRQVQQRHSSSYTGLQDENHQEQFRNVPNYSAYYFPQHKTYQQTNQLLSQQETTPKITATIYYKNRAGSPKSQSPNERPEKLTATIIYGSPSKFQQGNSHHPKVNNIQKPSTNLVMEIYRKLPEDKQEENKVPPYTTRLVFETNPENKTHENGSFETKSTFSIVNDTLSHDGFENNLGENKTEETTQSVDIPNQESQTTANQENDSSRNKPYLQNGEPRQENKKISQVSNGSQDDKSEEHTWKYEALRPTDVREQYKITDEEKVPRITVNEPNKSISTTLLSISPTTVSSFDSSESSTEILATDKPSVSGIGWNLNTFTSSIKEKQVDKNDSSDDHVMKIPERKNKQVKATEDILKPSTQAGTTEENVEYIPDILLPTHPDTNGNEETDFITNRTKNHPRPDEQSKKTSTFSDKNFADTSNRNNAFISGVNSESAHAEIAHDSSVPLASSSSPQTKGFLFDGNFKITKQNTKSGILEEKQTENVSHEDSGIQAAIQAAIQDQNLRSSRTEDSKRLEKENAGNNNIVSEKENKEKKINSPNNLSENQNAGQDILTSKHEESKNSPGEIDPLESTSTVTNPVTLISGKYDTNPSDLSLKSKDLDEKVILAQKPAKQQDISEDIKMSASKVISFETTLKPPAKQMVTEKPKTMRPSASKQHIQEIEPPRKTNPGKITPEKPTIDATVDQENQKIDNKTTLVDKNKTKQQRTVTTSDTRIENLRNMLKNKTNQIVNPPRRQPISGFTGSRVDVDTDKQAEENHYPPANWSYKKQ